MTVVSFPLSCFFSSSRAWRTIELVLSDVFHLRVSISHQVKKGVMFMSYSKVT